MKLTVGPLAGRGNHMLGSLQLIYCDVYTRC
jgi:hypothetical protein